MPGERGTVPPAAGWKEGGVYAVLVSFRATNPTHYAILHVGFLNERGEPGNYSELFCNTYEGVIPFSRHHRLEVVRELCVMRHDTLEFPVDPKPRALIEVKGGVVTSAWADVDLDVTVRDRDNIADGDDDPLKEDPALVALRVPERAVY